MKRAWTSWRNSRAGLAFALLLTMAACGANNRPRALEVPPLTVEKIPSRSLKRVRVLVKENFTVADIQNARRRPALKLVTQRGRLILLDAENNGWLAEAGGFRFEPATGQLIGLDGVYYRGVLEAFSNPLGRVVVVNELSLEDYLRGVVPNELGPSRFPYPAALEAQTVAARTYTVAGRGRFADLGFDLYADQRSQVYRGVSSEHPLSDQAVRDTSGRVALFRGSPIEAFYSSTCGGLTANYTEAFRGEPISYLQGGVQCPEPEGGYHRWKVSVDAAAIELNLTTMGSPSIGALQRIEIIGRGPTGRVTSARVTGPGGAIELGGLDLRRLLALRSHFLDRMETALDPQGNVSEVTVWGRGFGHGVGMCQVGAVALAQQGSSYDRILLTYYPGTGLARLY